MKSLIFSSLFGITIIGLAGKNGIPTSPVFYTNLFSIKSKAKKNLPIHKSQTFTVAQLRTIQNPEKGQIYQTNDCGGGLWQYDSKDKNSIDNIGTILVTQSGERFKRVYDPSKGVNIEWFGGAGDGKTDNTPAFERAKAALPDGGIINFGKGTYTSYKTWLVNKSDIFIKGMGADQTTLTADPSVGRTFDICLPREVDSMFVQGRNGNSNQLYPFVNSTKKDDNFIELKNASWAEDFPIGQEIFIRAGASYYDQEFGEMNFVVKKEGARLYLQYPLSRDYTYEKENWNGTLLKDFIPPPIGQTTIAEIKNPPGHNSTVPCSFGNDIYSVLSVNGNNVTVKNPGRGNGRGVIQAGTRVAKGRQVIKCFYGRNFRMEGVTVLGKQNRVLSTNNSTHTYIKNCIIIRNPSIAKPGPFTFTVDCTRDVTFDHVQFIAPDNDISTGQISRSSGDVTFKNCTFNNVSTDFSEFCFNILVDNCEYNMKGGQFATRLGKSSTYCTVTNSTFNVDSENTVISMDDIQGFKNSQREGSLVQKCVFHLNNVGTIFQNGGGGVNEFNDNKVTGNFGIICSTLRNSRAVSNPDKPNKLFVKNNIINANIRAFLFNAGDADIENNSITYIGSPSTHPMAGVIIRQPRSASDTTINSLILKNNKFNNWIKRSDVIQVDIKAHSHAIEISGNKVE